MSQYSAPEYEPTIEIRVTHSVFHIDPYALKIVDNTFKPLNDSNSINIDYFYSIVTVPAAILAIGILAILLLLIISNCCVPGTCFWNKCWYYLCCCCLCPPKEKEMTDIDIAKKEKIWRERQRKASKTCYSVLFVIVASTCFLWFGNSNLTTGMNKVSSTADYFKDVLSVLFNAVSDLCSSSNSIINALDNSGDCNNQYIQGDSSFQAMYDALTSSRNAINSAGSSINQLSDPVFSGIDMISKQVDNLIPQKDKIVLFIFIGLIIICFFNLLTVALKNAYVSFVVSIFNYVLMLALLVICSVFFVIVILISDFCIDPATSIMAIAGSSGSTVEYFTTCTGTNEFASYLDTLSIQLDQLQVNVGNSTSNTVGSLYWIEDNASQLYSCQPNCHACSTALNNELANIEQSITDIYYSLSCQTINSLYDTLINQAFCTDSFSGLYKIWGDLYFIALFLFVLLASISKLYQFMYSESTVMEAKPWVKKHYKLVSNGLGEEEQVTITAAELELANMSTVGGVELNVNNRV